MVHSQVVLGAANVYVDTEVLQKDTYIHGSVQIYQLYIIYTATVAVCIYHYALFKNQNGACRGGSGLESHVRV